MDDPEWVLELRSCLTSVKGGIPLNQIESELFQLTRTRIPYKNLGFPSLEACLNSSGQFTIQNRGGISIVHAVASNKTQHITELIKKQKSKPPKKKPFFGSKFAPRKFNTASSFNRPNHYSRPGTSSSYNGSVNSRSQGFIANSNNHKPSSSYNNSRSNQFNGYQSKTSEQNNYNKPRSLLNNRSKNTNDFYGNHQSNSDVVLAETKTLQQSNLINDDSKNNVKSVPVTNNTVPLNVNGKKLLPTSSCSSLESTYSSSSTNYSVKPLETHPLDKFQSKHLVNTTSQIVNINDKDKILKNNIYTMEKSNEFKTQQHISHAKIPSFQNMPIKPSTAQSRLNKYPKKCDESLIKVNGKENQSTNEVLVADQVTDLKIDVTDPYIEVNDDTDYIEELETYLKNLNLPEPYYEFMVKKEKSGKAIKLTHICMIKVNDKSVCSSFPVECSSPEYAKKVAAKHTLSALKKQYGESVVYPITSDINTMASRIKEFLKHGYQETGLLGDVLERMYREKFQENLPDNWIQLLEVYSYFMFDKLVANKIIIYLNEVENNHNGHESTNGFVNDASVEQDIVPGTLLTFEDYNEKSVLVSANYGSANIWIRFVGQNADENFIQMQAKFNDTMNNSGFSMAEQVTEGEYYAVLYNASWHRVQISSAIEEDDTVTCFMIDTGEQLNIAKDQICHLEPVFMKTKIQAIQCILTQLDYFDAFYGLKELLDEMILNKTFFLIPDTLEEGYLPRVTLYEKSKSGVSDRVNINDLIIQRFLEKTVPRLPSFEENAIVDGTVSSVVESGHLNLQLNSDIVSSLEEILPNEEFLSPDYFLKNKEEVKKDQIYLIKYETENIWCRVQVVELKDEIRAQIIYIDYGNIDECEITKLAKLDSYDPLMAKISPQAVKVSLHLLPPSIMTPGIADKIFEILGGESKVLVNVINAPTNEVPLVNLFKNLPDTPDTPLCINMQIAQSLKK